MRVIEPKGMTPAFVVVDMSTIIAEEEEELENDEGSYAFNDWCPPINLINKAREQAIKSMKLVLDQVNNRLNNGDYTLEPWRRILKNMKPKIYNPP